MKASEFERLNFLSDKKSHSLEELTEMALLYKKFYLQFREWTSVDSLEQ